MLRNVIEDYLTSINEIQLFEPYRQLLESQGFYDTHIIHGSTEFGKDIIAKKKINGTVVQFSFQLKAKDINTSTFRDEVKNQLLEAYTNKLSHPNFDRDAEYHVVFVTSGIIKPPVTINFQEFNEFLTNNLKVNAVKTIEQPELIEQFQRYGIEPFYTHHDETEVVGDFWEFYSKLKNNVYFDSFFVEGYTRKWLDYDWDNSINRLEILFESYFFSKKLIDDEKYYKAILILAALVRVLLKNNVYDSYNVILENYIEEILEQFTLSLSKIWDESDEYEVIKATSSQTFSIFEYPIFCHRSLELLSLCSLFITNDTLVDKSNKLIDKMLDEPGSIRPLSDNYAITVVLVSLVLFKFEKYGLLKKYINNITVWLCDRYEEHGLSTLGLNKQFEFEHLLSEYISGLDFTNTKSSFIANILLDIAYQLEDEEFYENVANDLKAVEIIPEHYHVLNEQALFSYDHISIVTSSDHDFSLQRIENYTKIITHEREELKISEFKITFLFLLILLRDRYFPSVVFDYFKASREQLNMQ